jgi:hypothetical protein
VLVDAGAGLEGQCGYGGTPLMHAASYARLEVFRTFVNLILMSDKVL